MSLGIASETHPSDIARHRAEAEYRREIRQLAANLLRVVRGAGRPLTITEEVHAVFRAAAAFEAAHGYPPGAGHSEWLTAALPEISPDYGDFDCNWRHGENQIIAGALQIAASILTGQPAHEAVGKKQMTQAVYLFERTREEARREPAREARAAKAVPKRKSKAKRTPASVSG